MSDAPVGSVVDQPPAAQPGSGAPPANQQPQGEAAPPTQQEQPARPDWMYGRPAPYQGYGPPPSPPRPEQHQQQQRSPQQEIDEVNRYLDERIARYVGPLAQELTVQRDFQRRKIESDVRDEAGRTAQAVEYAYKTILNSDPAFSNPEVKGHAERVMQDYMRDGVAAAQRGDFSRLRDMQNPLFYQMILFGSKQRIGWNPDGTPQVPYGAESEFARTQPQRGSRYAVDDDMRAVLQQRGISEERYLQALKQRDELGWEDMS